MGARDDYPLLDVPRQSEDEDEMWPSGVEWWHQHHAALDEIDRLRASFDEVQRLVRAKFGTSFLTSSAPEEAP